MTHLRGGNGEKHEDDAVEVGRRSSARHEEVHAQGPVAQIVPCRPFRRRGRSSGFVREKHVDEVWLRSQPYPPANTWRKNKWTTEKIAGAGCPKREIPCTDLAGRARRHFEFGLVVNDAPSRPAALGLLVTAEQGRMAIAGE